MCFNILPGSVSFGCSAASSASQAFFMKVSTFGLFAAMLFPWSSFISCLRKNQSAFSEYGPCVSGYRGACVCEHHRPDKTDGNSREGLRP
jgi:hypothetical protein